MQRRKFSREFKIEAVKLVRERGLSMAQAGPDLGVHDNVLRKWLKDLGCDPTPVSMGLKPPLCGTRIADADRPGAGLPNRRKYETCVAFLQ